MKRCDRQAWRGSRKSSERLLKARCVRHPSGVWSSRKSDPIEVANRAKFQARSSAPRRRSCRPGPEPGRGSSDRQAPSGLRGTTGADNLREEIDRGLGGAGKVQEPIRALRGISRRSQRAPQDRLGAVTAVAADVGAHHALGVVTQARE